jgi:hypothetical protein
LRSPLDKSKCQKLNSLGTEDSVDEVDEQDVHGQGHKQVVDLAVQKAKWLDVPVDELDVAVHIGQAVETPSGDFIAALELGLALKHVRLPVDNYPQRQEHCDCPKPTEDDVVKQLEAAVKSCDHLVEHEVCDVDAKKDSGGASAGCKAEGERSKDDFVS